MNWKKFLAPNLVLALALLVLWATGVDTIVEHHNDDRVNIQKYIEVEKYIVDNYVDPVNINAMYQNSMKAMVANLGDSTIKIKDTPLDTTFKGQPPVKTIKESVLNFEKAYLYLTNKYPKENMDKLTAYAVRGMFHNLDPHSIYITPEENKRVGEEFSGKFSGIGVQFDIINDTITVVAPISGGPSEKLGIRSGDKIVTINGKSAVGFDNDQVVNTLRGPKGSVVDVGIVRPDLIGEKTDNNHIMHFRITRDNISLNTIDTYYMLDHETGYIKINRFARTTHEEFMHAADSLQHMGMKRLILDLRGNPGGFLDQALEIANEFYPRGVKLLSTKSRHQRYDNVFRTTHTGELVNDPLIIMIDEGSASASEIVSGAIQDHDRGLIVGRRSFGKGLVQQQYNLPDSSAIRVTISRFYTPSGRLIQKPYSHGREQYAFELMRRSENAKTDARQFIKHVPDSLIYHTDAGRPVYGGGGIVPDHIIQNDTTSSYIFGLMQRKGIGTEFVIHYMEMNGKKLRREYGNHFNKFMKDFKWSNQEMARFKSIMVKNGLVESDTVKTPSFKKDKLYVKTGTYNKQEWIFRGYMKAELARQIWDPSHYYHAYHDIFDKMLKTAMTLWPDVEHLQQYAATHTDDSGK